MKCDVQLEIQTNADLTSWAVGERILSPLFCNAKLTPQKAAIFGDVTAKYGFDVENIEDCKEHWASKAEMRHDGSLSEFNADFNWKRRKIAKSQGYVTFSNTNRRGKKIPARVWFRSQYRKEIDWAGLFVNWCEITAPFAAILHPLVSMDRPKRNDKDVRDYNYEEDVFEQAWSRFLSGTFYCEFRAGELNSMVSGLTNLGWASWFGDDFAKEVNEKAIAAAGFPIQKIGNGYLVQVTEDINDVCDDFPKFSKRRAELKALFRDDLFLIKEEPVSTEFKLQQQRL